MSKRGKKILIGIGLLILIIIILAGLSDFVVKWIWMDRLGFSTVFSTIKITQISLFICAFVIAFIYVGANVYFLSKKISPLQLNLGEMPSGETKYVHLKTSRIKKGLYIVGGLVSFFFALSYFFRWNEFFRFYGAQSFGSLDPVFHNDISFYMLRLPFLETLQNSFSFLVFIVTLFLIVYNLVSGKIRLGKSGSGSGLLIDRQPRKQLFTNIGIWFLLLGWGYYLSRYHLLYQQHSLIFGAGYTQVHFVIPVLWVLFFGCIVLAALSFFQNYRYKLGRFIKGVIGLIVLAILGAIVPSLIQNYKVDPNELILEKPFIKTNIKYTRMAYRLDSIKREDYNASAKLTYAEVRANQATINNVRIWDPVLIKNTYSQLQEIRLYYEFNDVDLDRYHTSQGYRQVLVSARELVSTLPPQARTWINNHLQYTHGNGLVMSPSVEKDAQGNPILYIKDIPPVSTIGMDITQPSIYYGEKPTPFKLVNTKIAELDYPKGDKNVYTHYDGNGGVPIDGFLKQALFSWYFGDINLLLTDYIRQGSKIQFWTSVHKRIHEIAPFLAMEDDPYMVVSNGKLYWMQDAYTTGQHFPYAEPYNRQFNYIRNSVKIVIDAYQGTVDFYVADKTDPILKVYQHWFPDMFKPLSTMPEGLRQHIKYPKYLFTTQLEMFSTYHMTDPQVFYNKEDLWRRPKENYGGRTVLMQPYYMLSSLPASEKLEYLLISPMTPKSRSNMISWVVAQSDFPNYGKLTVYELPKEQLFLGPDQIEAMINQTTAISKQLSLWDQRGSQVMRGNLMVVPIEHSFLYVEPVFLIAQGIDIPQLKRVIATTGTHIVMAPTLDDAIDKLYNVVPDTTSAVSIDSTQTAAANKGKITIPANSAQLKQLKKVWGELQTALQNKDWKNFGEKMEAINKMLEKEKKKDE